jgi:ABC-type branched-subunit amino acid transport system ATPase component
MQKIGKNLALRPGFSIAIGPDGAGKTTFITTLGAALNRQGIETGSVYFGPSERTGFIYAHITPEFLKKTATFEVVIFLSVLHHVIYEHGVDVAETIPALFHANLHTCEANDQRLHANARATMMRGNQRIAVRL